MMQVVPVVCFGIDDPILSINRYHGMFFVSRHVGL